MRVTIEDTPTPKPLILAYIPLGHVVDLKSGLQGLVVRAGPLRSPYAVRNRALLVLDADGGGHFIGELAAENAIEGRGIYTIVADLGMATELVVKR